MKNKENKMKHLILLILILVFCLTLFAQNVGINADGSDPDASAMLEVKSANRGFLIPRMTAEQIALIQAPAFGLLVFQTNGTSGFYYNSGSPASPVWKLLLTEVSAADGSETKVNAGSLISVNGTGTQADPYVVAFTGNNLALGETSATAYRGDRGKTAYDHSQQTTGAVHGSSTVGLSMLRLSNPSAIRFLRINADNTVTALSDSDFRTAIGAGTSSLALGTSSTTAHRGDYGNTAYTHSQATTGAVHGSTTVGANMLRLSNPSAVRFLRINADNTVSALTDADFRTALGVGTGTGTVTSIATGNGITGGTITSTGTLGLTGQALAVHNLATSGLIARTGTGTVAGRTLTASGNGISVSNGNGVSGNPTVSLSIGTGATQVAAGDHTHSEYDAIPAGSIMQYAGSTAPTGWKLCDGTLYSTTTYATLYAVIGTTYGSGSGTFRVPDLRQRIPVGKYTSGTFATLGATGGTQTHTITTAQLPSHTHAYGTLATNSTGAHSHDVTGSAQQTTTTSSPRAFAMPYVRDASGGHYDDGNADDMRFYINNSSSYIQTTDVDWLLLGNASLGTASAGDHSHTISGATASIGSGDAIPILQPYIVLNYIIKY